MAQTYYQEASVSPGVQNIHYTDSFSGCSDGTGHEYNQYLAGEFEVTWGTLTMLSTLPLIQKNSQWIPSSVSATQCTSLGICAANGQGETGGSFYTSSLAPNGMVTTVEQGSFSSSSEAGTIFSTETLDLNTGKYTWDRTIDDAFDGDCTGGATLTQDRTADLPISLYPTTAPNFTVYFANPFPNYASTGANPTVANVLSAPLADGLAADGMSAAVVVVQSNSKAPVSLTLTAPTLGATGTGPFGSLAPIVPNYLSNPSPSGTTELSPISPTSCDSDNNCTFLALLWSPAVMPGGGAVSSLGGYTPIPLLITATQASTSDQATILLQPPPLVLVHGIWSSAAQAWPLFQQWLSLNYAQNLVFPADYGKPPYNYSFLAFSDPRIQNVMEGTIANALASAASNAVVARQVDVVAHSMGGLVTRYFMENPFPYPSSYLPLNPVHKLITIGTPHQGTPLATELEMFQDVPVGETGTGTGAALAIGFICANPFKPISPCTLSNFFGSLGRPIGGAVLSLEAGLPGPDETQYSSIVGLKPTSPTSPTSTTENYLNLIIHGFVSASQSVDGIINSPSDTLVSEASQVGFPVDTDTINGIVHTQICPLGCSDTGETSSSSVWSQAAFWLMGGSGAAPAQSSSSIVQRTTGILGIHALDGTTGSAGPILDLTGYTQVDASNVSFSPTSGSTLTINSAASIAATSPTKTITEVLLFQTVSDPTDVPLFYSTQSPFSITFTPTRMGSTSFVAFAVFSDMTFSATALQYTFQPSGNPVDLTLVNSPAENLPIGSSTVVSAQAGFSNGQVDVTQLAAYAARNGTSSVFTVGSDGLITTTGPGVDWLDVSYGGFTASAQIMAGSCAYSLSPVNQIVDFSGGTVSIQVTTATGCAWTSDDGGAAWLTAASASGTGSGTITLTASANTTGSTQVAFVTIANQDVAITQPATACTYALSQTEVSLSASGGSGTITVTTSCPITASSNAAWLVPVVLSNSVEYTAAANTSSAPQSATLTIGTQTVDVTEAAGLTATATTVTSSVNPSVTGQSVTFTAIVTPSSGSGVPTGSVAFMDGATQIGTGTLNSQGQATFAPSSLSQGSHSIAAQYSGDSNFSASTSAALTQTVNVAAAVASLAPTTLSFGNQAVGTTSAASAVTVTNTGTASLTFTSIAATGDFAVAASGTTCSTSAPVAAGSNCAINVTFTPKATGSRSGSLSLTDNASGSPQTVSLSGTGTGPTVSLSAAPTFPSEPVATTSSSQTVTLTNSGNGSLTFTAIAVSGPFAIATSGTTCSTSSPVAAAATCAVAVTFTPTAGGAASGSLSFSDNAPSSPQTLALTGTGQDFTITSPSGSSTSATVAPGSPASYTLSVGGEGGLSGTVTFTCTGAPSEATCTVSPNAVTAGSSATNVTVTVTTTAASVSAPHSRHLPPTPPLSRGLRGLWMLALALALTAWTIARRNQLGVGRGRSTIVPLALGLLLTLALAGCGGGGGGGGGTTTPSNPGTPAGTYTLTVTGSTGSGSSALSHSMTLTLTVS
jgi:pimeloyl-ACP methyl ester carboxylesterase